MAISWPERQAWLAAWRQGKKDEDDGDGITPMKIFGLLSVATAALAVAVAAAALYLCWRYPLLVPAAVMLGSVVLLVGRLMLLNQNDQLLREYEGINNPRVQRIFCWLALALLSICAAITFGAFYYNKHWLYAAVVVPLMGYIAVVCTVFELTFVRWMDNANAWLSKAWEQAVSLFFGILLGIIALVSPKELEDSDYE